jgi:hypothetical protein
MCLDSPNLALVGAAATLACALPVPEKPEVFHNCLEVAAQLR